MVRARAPESARARPAGPGDIAAARDTYARIAGGINGFLDRPTSWWDRISEAWPERSVYVVEGSDGALDGYLVYQQIDGEHSALGGAFGIAVDELVTTTRDSALALWGLLGSWATQVDQIIVRTTPEDPLLLLLPEQQIPTLAEIRWMTRIVDPVGAVEARGFPPGLAAEVPLELTDAQLAANSGRYVLRVSQGRGRLEPGGRGGVTLDIGAFSSLYCGWATTGRLAWAGRACGGSADERASLDAAFAGPTAWMLDEF